MKRSRWCAGIAVCALLAPARTAAQAVAITNVNVIPMDRERVLPGQTVVIDRGVIVEMGTRVRIPPAARVVDGAGKYLIPGLADVHVHLASNPPDEQRHLLQLFVANGVTTVLNMRGIPQILELRRAVAAGEVLGPEIYTAGPYVNEPFFTTPEQVEQAVVEQKRAGYDFVKMHGNLSREAYARLNAVARREGIRVVGHAPRNLGPEVMFEERQYAVAHAEEFIYDRESSSNGYEQIVPRIPELGAAMARERIWLMPNLTAFRTIGVMVGNLDSILARPEMRYLPRSNQVGWGPETNPYTRRMRPEQSPGILAIFAVLQQLTGGFHAQGVRMLVGTDAMNTGVIPGFSAHDELAELVQAGLTPYEALQAATANAAAFLGASDPRGTVAVGNRADLVLLDTNPLENIANTRRIAGVVLRGRWLPREEITRMLEHLRESSRE